MKRALPIFLSLVFLSHWAFPGKALGGSGAAKVQPVEISAVHWTSGFWAARFDACRTSTIPALWAIMEGTNYSQYLKNFRIAAGQAEGRHRGAPFNDGDFYKWMEAASAVLAVTNDPGLARRLDDIIAVIAQAQRADGYIHTPALIARDGGRLAAFSTNVGKALPFHDRLQFETYNMGHLLSAACVHYRATGQTNFLNVALKTADFLCATFEHPTPELARFSICPSHYMGMVDLYRATREPCFLNCAKKLLATRDLVQDGDDDNQDRIAFLQQTNAMGHAVRANYLYAGAADLFLETSEPSLWSPLSSIWSNVVEKKMYLTGGCGALYDGASPDGSTEQKTITRIHQAYGRDYQLPNATAHNETCANIGNVLWNWRMFLASGEARYLDVLELALYNSVLSGVDFSGTNFFYVNPLRALEPDPVALRWKRQRVPYMSSFCCPPNLARILAEVGSMAYSKSADGIWVSLYGSSTLNTELKSGRLKLTQQTEYPWNGNIRLVVDQAPQTEITLSLRIPEWTKNPRALLNNRPINAEPTNGFISIQRLWRAGDSVELELPMTPRVVESNPLVEETVNQVAIKRGPLVYCIESTDFPRNAKLLSVSISADTDLLARFDRYLLGGVVIIEANGFVRDASDWSGRLYKTYEASSAKPMKLQFIPYFAWNNRGASEMTVWLPIR